MEKITYILTALITTFAASLHLYRLLINGDMIIGTWFVPAYLSGIAFLLAGYLAIFFWKKVLK